jgi:hypothetical protein
MVRYRVTFSDYGEETEEKERAQGEPYIPFDDTKVRRIGQK